MKLSYSALIILFSIAFSANTYAEEPSELDLNGEINWSVIQTELEKKALGFAATITPKLNESRYFTAKNGVGYLGPTVKINTGGNDSFESFLAKISGFYMLPLPLDSDGEPDTKNSVHIMPFSIGMESDSNFDRPTALAELGWTPIGPRKIIDSSNQERFGLDPSRSFGLFVQLGYKLDDTDNTTGSTTPQNQVVNKNPESSNETISRLKAELVYGFDLGSSVTLTPKAIGWYDIKDDELYHKIEALLRVAVIKDKYSLDFKYEQGSGAPNFSKGDQFGVGLTMAF